MPSGLPGEGIGRCHWRIGDPAGARWIAARYTVLSGLPCPLLTELAQEGAGIANRALPRGMYTHDAPASSGDHGPMARSLGRLLVGTAVRY